jgi:peptidoglycan biosynthesis protein MviN/MurJ (putative lipid II flippase)
VGGPQYAEWCFPATAVLSATLTIGVAQSVASRILYGMGKLKLFARLALVEAFTNLMLSLALVGPFGLVGVAFAVALPNVLFCVFVITYACRTLEVTISRYLFACWLKPLCAACVPALVWLAVTPVEATWPAIALGILAGLAPYACVVAALEVLAASRRRALSPALVFDSRLTKITPAPRESAPSTAEA